MRGDFDLDSSAWPIGYLRSGNIYGSGHSGPLYKVTDMRTLNPVLNQDFPLDEAVALAAKINHAVRAGSTADVITIALQILEG